MYAIVDIETTGGIAGRHRITEIAILIHNGREVVETYNTLINPLEKIPPFIRQLTGISNEMVENAPKFSSVAQEIHRLLKDKIFVAHNAVFDFSFVKQSLEEEGYELTSRKLCTVRLSRKIFPGMQRYSLGNLCRDLNIDIVNRHRAMGDAAATTLLFEKLIRKDEHGWIEEMLKSHKGHQPLPPNLDTEKIKSLPKSPGVYHFLGKKGELLYVGKARSIRSRVRNHFNYADHDGHENKLRELIYDVTYEETGNEFVALLLENDLIKRKQPPYNKAQKFWTRNYCLFSYKGQDNILHLAIERYKPALQPLRVFPNFLMAREYLTELIESYGLCARFSHLQTAGGACFATINGSCIGICTNKKLVDEYNTLVGEAIDGIKADLGTFVLTGKGRNKEELTVVLVENGHYLGFGFLGIEEEISSIDLIKEKIVWRPDTPDIQYLLMRHIDKHPERRIILHSQSGN